MYCYARNETKGRARTHCSYTGGRHYGGSNRQKNGRGAYLTNEEEVFLIAKKRDSLSRHLQVNVGADDYDRLIAERKATV